MAVALAVVGYLCFAIAFTITTCGFGQANVLFSTIPILVVGKWPIDIIIVVASLLAGTRNPLINWLGGGRVQPYASAFVIVGCIGLGYISGNPAFVGKCT